MKKIILLVFMISSFLNLWGQIKPKLHFSATNEYHFAWYNGMVTIGNSAHLDEDSGPKSYIFPTGKSEKDLLCISSNYEKLRKNIQHFAWFKDGTVSMGQYSRTPAKISLTNGRSPYRFVLAPGKTMEDVLCISSNSDMHFAWYKDGTVSAGKSTNLANERSPYRFVLATGKTINDVICISSNDDMHFAWYKDGTVSAGSSDNLASKRQPYPFRLGFNKNLKEIL